MNLNQIDVTGCRVVGAITKELGHAGPKHHGVIIGQAVEDNHIYVAENMHDGYQLSTYENFWERYSPNGEVIIQPNDGLLENISVAQRALDELNMGGMGAYNLITNNCECFVNRAMHNKSVSTQVINTALGIAALVGLVYVLKKSR